MPVYPSDQTDADRNARDYPWLTSPPPGMGSAGRVQGNAEELDLARYFALIHGGEAAEALATTMQPDLPKGQLGCTPAAARANEVFRRRFIPLAAKVLHQWQKLGPLTFVTIIPQGCYFRLGELHRANLQSIRLRIKREIEALFVDSPASRFGLFIGMIEVSVRCNKRGEAQGYQLHVHAICDETMKEAIWKGRSKPFGRGPARVSKPVDCQSMETLADIHRRLGYLSKLQVRVERPYSTTSHSTGDSGPVLQLELPGDMAVEPLLWMSRWRYSDFTVIIGTNRLRSAARMKW